MGYSCFQIGTDSADLASYAKQAKDDAMYQMAVKIQVRAMRRAGELLSEIETQSHKNAIKKREDNTVPSFETRTQVARNAGHLGSLKSQRTGFLKCSPW
ncbi:MAG: hypothetical protein ABL903_01995 [Methylococcales bacterium]